MSLAFDVIIPARFGSSRLPGKPLLDIAGKPMVQHVWERARQSGAERVIIATDDSRIEQAAQAFGADVCMTSAEHASGTDRLEEVSRRLVLPADRIIVNVQGDEPLIAPELIRQVAANLQAHPAVRMATLCERIHDIQQVFNPNCVKVVCDARGYALYFSRAPIPWARDAFTHSRELLPADTVHYRHIGIYAYRVSLLQQFILWPQAPHELSEALEQLRVQYQGERIHVEESCVQPGPGVDTAEDLERVRQWLATNA